MKWIFIHICLTTNQFCKLQCIFAWLWRFCWTYNASMPMMKFPCYDYIIISIYVVHICLSLWTQLKLDICFDPDPYFNFLTYLCWIQLMLSSSYIHVVMALTKIAYHFFKISIHTFISPAFTFWFHPRLTSYFFSKHNTL